MSAVQNRRRLAPVLFASLASLMILAGCTGQKDPDDWSDSVKESFVEGCDGTAAKSETVPEIKKDLEAIKQPTKVCECVYDYLEANMKFSEFKAANNERRDEPNGKQPALTGGVFTKAYDKCNPESKATEATTTTAKPN